MDGTRKSGLLSEGAGESPRPSARAMAAAWARDVLKNDFTAVRVELLRHLEYDEKDPRFAEYDGLVKLHRKGQLDDAGLRRLKELGPTVPLDTGSYPDAYDDVRDAILRGDAVPFADAGAFDESAANPETAGAADRIRRSFPTLLGGRTATVTSDVREALGKILGGNEGPKVIPVVKLRLPGSGKENAVGQARAECSAELWSAIKESVLPNGRDARHAVIVANRSYSDAFTGLTDEPDLGVDANEARFARRGRLIADLSHGENAMKMPRVQDCARFAGRAEARAAFNAAGGALTRAITLRATKPEAKAEGFPEGIEAELDDMGVVELQNLANALLRDDPALAKSLSGCGVPELDLMALRAAMGVRPFEEKTKFDEKAAVKAFIALAKTDSLGRAGGALEAAEKIGVTGKLAALLVRDDAILRMVRDAAKKTESGGLASFAAVLEVTATADTVFSRSLDDRISGARLPEGKRADWPLGGEYRPKFRVSDADGNPVLDTAKNDAAGGILEALLPEPGVTVIEADGGSGKSLLAAEAAKEWLETGGTHAHTKLGRVAYVSLSGRKIDKDKGFERGADGFPSGTDVMAGADTIVLDSLDEADWTSDDGGTVEERRKAFAGWLRSAAKGKRVLLTSRTGYYTGKDARRLKMEDFSTELADKYARSYVLSAGVPEGDRATLLADWEGFLAETVANPDLLEVAQNPLNLMLLCEVVIGNHGNGTARPFSWYAAHLGHLFEDAAVGRVQLWEPQKKPRQEAGKKSPNGDALRINLEKNKRTQGLMDGLGQLAYLLGTGRHLTEKNITALLPEACRVALGGTGDEEEALDLRPLSLLVKKNADGGIGFAHERMREYFAARHICAMIHTGQDVPLREAYAVFGSTRFRLEDMPDDLAAAPGKTGVAARKNATKWKEKKYSEYRSAFLRAHKEGPETKAIAHALRSDAAEFPREAIRMAMELRPSGRHFDESIRTEQRDGRKRLSLMFMMSPKEGACDLARILHAAASNGGTADAADAAWKAALPLHELSFVLEESAQCGLPGLPIRTAIAHGASGRRLTTALVIGARNGAWGEAISAAMTANLEDFERAEILGEAAQHGGAEAAIVAARRISPAFAGLVLRGAARGGAGTKALAVAHEMGLDPETIAKEILPFCEPETGLRAIRDAAIPKKCIAGILYFAAHGVGLSAEAIRCALENGIVGSELVEILRRAITHGRAIAEAGQVASAMLTGADLAATLLVLAENGGASEAVRIAESGLRGDDFISVIKTAAEHGAIAESIGAAIRKLSGVELARALEMIAEQKGAAGQAAGAGLKALTNEELARVLVTSAKNCNGDMAAAAEIARAAGERLAGEPLFLALFYCAGRGAAKEAVGIAVSKGISGDQLFDILKFLPERSREDAIESVRIALENNLTGVGLREILETAAGRGAGTVAAKAAVARLAGRNLARILTVFAASGVIADTQTAATEAAHIAETHLGGDDLAHVLRASASHGAAKEAALVAEARLTGKNLEDVLCESAKNGNAPHAVHICSDKLSADSVSWVIQSAAKGNNPREAIGLALSYGLLGRELQNVLIDSASQGAVHEALGAAKRQGLSGHMLSNVLEAAGRYATTRQEAEAIMESAVAGGLTEQRLGDILCLVANEGADAALSAAKKGGLTEYALMRVLEESIKHGVDAEAVMSCLGKLSGDPLRATLAVLRQARANAPTLKIIETLGDVRVALSAGDVLTMVKHCILTSMPPAGAALKELDDTFESPEHRLKKYSRYLKDRCPFGQEATITVQHRLKTVARDFSRNSN